REVAPAPNTTEPDLAVPWWASWHWTDWLLAAYGGVAMLLLGRWVLANLAVAWMLRRREPIPDWLADLFASMPARRGRRLVISSRVRVPFSVGLFRPAVVLPLELVECGTEQELRWVLAHELSHLERQDTRMAWLFAIGQIVYFYLPWFW